MGATDDEMRAQKARDRAARSLRDQGTVSKITGNVATVSLGLTDVDAVVPVSVPGVVVGSTVRVQMANTPTIESVLGDPAADVCYLPGGWLICKGNHSFPADAGVRQSYTWTFPAEFGATPTVLVIPDTTAPDNCDVSRTGTTTTQATIYFYRSTDFATNVGFVAFGLAATS